MASTALNRQMRYQLYHPDIIDTTAHTCLDIAMMGGSFVCLGSFLQDIFRRMKILVATHGHQLAQLNWAPI